MSLIGDSVPILSALATAIVEIIDAENDERAQLAALMTAAEAVKLRLDQLKFPKESKEG